ncbi:SH3 domain-containing protein [Bacillus lacus]|uniref:SH3 domain-containing protein n=1 Tax=Metabacillus lacus TaxID=1983721 RepID=A0A7X2LZK1_9BACI|nr:SH3 domain-containing protein [Metabacillus lacus]MRX73028.1 SH3 domain-containing protein [Metabacillus lacus]
MSLISVFFFSVVSSASAAAEPFFGRTASSIHLHRGATADYAVTTTLKANEELLVISSFTNNRGEKWLQVQSKSARGWIKSAHLRAFGINGVEVQPLSGNVNIRRGADTSYRISGTLSNGTSAFVIDSFTNRKGEKWVKVTNPLRGLTGSGWVRLDGLRLPQVKTEVATKVVYSHPQHPAKVSATAALMERVDSLAYGTPVKITAIFDGPGYDHPVAKISYGPGFTKTGWTGYEVTAHYYRDMMNKQYTITSSKAALRSGASDTYRTVATLTKGTPVTVTDVYFTYNQPEPFWIKVTAPGGKTGWVNLKDV